MEIRIGSEIFKTKKALLERIRKMLYAAAPGVELGPPEHGFLLSLLQLHPEAKKKIGQGAKAFRVITSEYGNRGFEVIRLNEDWTDFSFMKCMNGRNPWLEFIHALRKAVDPQIWDAKQKAFIGNKEINCPLSGKPMTRDQAHADHIHPDTFDALVKRFCEMEKLDHGNLPLGPSVDGQMGRKLTDSALEARWKEFHSKNAKIRVISETEHRKLKRK
jgi:uncharacterized protein DUF3223